MRVFVFLSLLIFQAFVLSGCKLKVLQDGAVATSSSAESGISILPTTTTTTTPPAISDPTLALSDGGSATSGYAWQQAISVSIGSDSSAAKWCLSESQNTAPASGSAACGGGNGGSNGWHTARPTAFSLSAGDGAKTVYVWVANSADDVNDGTISSSITLDTVNPGAFAIAGLTDSSGDSVQDAHLTHGFNPSVHWGDGANEDSYLVTVYENDGSTVKCSTVTKTAGAVSHAFSTCALSDQTQYKATVVAHRSSGRSQAASNSPFTFRVNPSLSFTAGSQAIGEAGGSTSATANLSRTTSANVSASLVVSGSASNPADHDLSNGSISIPSGNLTDSKSVTIANDAVYETHETIVLSLSGATNAALVAGTNFQHGIVINDNDFAAMPLPKVVGGYDHSCALLTGGIVKCWGSNNFGQLGTGDVHLGDAPGEMGDSLPSVNLGTGRTAKAVAAGENRVCVILDDNSLKCWGDNSEGHLGRGDTLNRGGRTSETGDGLAPIDLGTGKTAKQVSQAVDHVCAILNDDSLKCWGNGGSGALGRGSNSDIGDGTGEMGDALPVVSLGAGRTAKKVVTSRYNTCVLMDNNQVKCWGANNNGSLGQEISASFGSLAVETPDALPAINLGTGRSAIDISLGINHACAVLDNGRIKCWGSASSAQLGYGDTVARGANPGSMGDGLPYVDLGTGRTATQIVSSMYFNCALLDNATVKCWGHSSSGQTGGNFVIGDGPGEMGDNLQPINLGTGRTALRLTAGGYSMCARLDDNSLKCWGNNANGVLGLGDVNHRGDAANELGDFLPAVNLGTGRSISSTATSPISIGLVGCAILDTGALKCWGSGTAGALTLVNVNRGDESGEMGPNTVAVDLGAGRTALDISAGSQHTCALLDNFSVKCWGYNGIGHLGLGDYESRGDSPNEMGDNLPAVNLGTGRSAIAISSKYQTNCAILDNNQLKCWGRNSAGHLGLGDNANRGDGNDMGDLLPATNVGASRIVSSVSAGENAVCAILDNSSLKCWGINSSGQLGLGDTQSRGDGANEMGDNLPAVELGTGREVRAVAGGQAHFCAILDDATVKCWGNSSLGGQLGQGHTNAIGDGPGEMGDSLPVTALGTGRTARKIEAGALHICSILDDSSTKCWGQNGRGQSGFGVPNFLGTAAGQMGDNLPVLSLGTGRTALQLGLGRNFSCFSLDNGSIKCIGVNDYGQLGLEDIIIRGKLSSDMGDNLPALDLD